jgi:hypothetical protein
MTAVSENREQIARKMKNHKKNLGVMLFFALITFVFLIFPVSADFNVSSNQSDLNWEVYATTPVNPTNTTGIFWVNWSWDVGTGRIPPTSWNVSINESWYNDTTNTHYNQSTVAGHSWINISVWGYNSTDNVLSENCLEGQQQAANSPITITNTSNWEGLEGELVYLDFGYIDLDNDTATFATDATKGTFNTTTGVFEWQPGWISQGTYFWNFTVSDGWGSEDYYVATITVGAPPYETISFDLANTNIAMMIMGLALIPILSILGILIAAIFRQEEVDWRVLLTLFAAIGIASALLLIFFVLVVVIQTV